MSAHCRSCDAAIIWTTTETGKRMPVNEAPSHGGNVLLIPPSDPRDPPVAKVVQAGKGTHRSHFATCPNAGSHRK